MKISIRILQFVFLKQIFQILRFVSVFVVSDVIEDLPPSKPYTNPPRFAAKMKRGEIVNGIELSGYVFIVFITFHLDPINPIYDTDPFNMMKYVWVRFWRLY